MVVISELTGHTLVKRSAHLWDGVLRWAGHRDDHQCGHGGRTKAAGKPGWTRGPRGRLPAHDAGSSEGAEPRLRLGPEHVWRMLA